MTGKIRFDAVSEGLTITRRKSSSGGTVIPF